MGLLAWVMMGLAIWHFTIFLPDRFWGGIVGAFVGSLVGAIVVGLIIYAVKVSALRGPRAEGDRHRRRPLRDTRRADRHGRRIPRGHPSRTPPAARHGARRVPGARVQSTLRFLPPWRAGPAAPVPRDPGRLARARFRLALTVVSPAMRHRL